jgi:selenocysteine-specific elongation factor
MLAGVGGIDAALFVVAADEGVMPQTREHLAILDLLGVSGGVIALTKVDMVDDPEWLELVEIELREAVQGTVLADAPIVPVSARTGQGIAELQAVLGELLAQLPPRVDQGHPRLPVDRVFTISGFGTVVTGTLVGGSLRVGDAIELQPGGLTGRIRGLQAYKTKLDLAQPGSRVAVNLSGIDKDEVRRGQVLTSPGWLRDTTLVDVRLRHLPDASRPLKHNAEVKFFSGAAEAQAHVRLLDADVLAPGAQGWVQIRLAEPVALARGDRFILRYPSPGETIGGGMIVDAAPGRRWRRHRSEVIARLETLTRGTPAELITQTLERLGGPARLDALLKRGGLPAEEMRAALAQAEAERAGDQVAADADLIWLRNHTVQLTPRQQQAVDDLLRAFQRAPYTPPSVKDSVAQVGEPLFRFLVERGDLVLVAPDVVLSRMVYREFMQAVTGMLDAAGSVSARELRDRFDTTRKYAIAFLEHLDAQGITRRDGDVRVWGRRPVG